MLGAGAEVTVRDGHLVLRPLTPVPMMREGIVLHQGDPDDPLVFRADLSERGGRNAVPVVFSADAQTGAMPRLHMLDMTLTKRPAVRNPKPWATGALAAGAATIAARRRRGQLGR